MTQIDQMMLADTTLEEKVYEFGKVKVNAATMKGVGNCPGCGSFVSVEATSWSMPDGTVLGNWECKMCGESNPKVSYSEWTAEWNDANPDCEE